jgi:hypothetical protein
MEVGPADERLSGPGGGIGLGCWVWGPIRVDRGRRRDEKVMIGSALTLLTNAVIAYNT